MREEALPNLVSQKSVAWCSKERTVRRSCFIPETENVVGRGRAKFPPTFSSFESKDFRLTGGIGQEWRRSRLTLPMCRRDEFWQKSSRSDEFDGRKTRMDRRCREFRGMAATWGIGDGGLSRISFASDTILEAVVKDVFGGTNARSSVDSAKLLSSFLVHRHNGCTVFLRWKSGLVLSYFEGSRVGHVSFSLIVLGFCFNS
mmetsp:Transcript_12624/g.26595  ORF Transcript_12624/g.26595 Transcript_12624/m.26595 type:complete len:201 (+) Transcript_12624:1254-1856(+)